MQVKLISMTKVDVYDRDISWDTSPEELIVYVARVSNPANQGNMETAGKLISYLIKNHHWSPFEMVDFTVEIKTSRAIAAQILRHWSFSFQEFSQRYAEVNVLEPIQFRLQADKNRQSSTEDLDLTKMKLSSDEAAMFVEGVETVQDVVNAVLTDSMDLYKLLLKKGVAKECARMVLPLTTQTTLYMKGTVRDWIHYLNLRTDEHTQAEHRQIAIAIQQIFTEKFPVIAGAIWPGVAKQD